ncbi:hypothetical protein RI543_002552 [Arxiozyma heterogenica]|uniref:Uncharacterized protein n=1 Tax=Arxiozyma heterogenica TaxID=278026 RepID=A0AAN7WNV7_9SACH|nr:hypothetical protein RI543_002552 [Kazachstania heterogenica]
MLVKTVKRTVSRDASNNEVFVPIEIIATIPNNIDSENSKRIPISLTFRNVNDSQEIAKLQCYHYAIPRYNSKDIVDIPLISSVNDWISEVSRKIAVSIARKYGKPCYTKLMLIFKFNKFEVSLLGKKAMRLINQVGFSDFFEESKSDDSYRNDPTLREPTAACSQRNWDPDPGLAFSFPSFQLERGLREGEIGGLTSTPHNTHEN